MYAGAIIPSLKREDSQDKDEIIRSEDILIQVIQQRFYDKKKKRLEETI